MSITPELAALIKRLNYELNQIEQQITRNLNLVRELLHRFPSNAILVQYFAYFNTVLFFVETSRQQLQKVVEVAISSADIQSSGEELATLLGQILEVRLKVEQLGNNLEEQR